MTDQSAAAIEHNPILAAFRSRFVRNPEVNELTPLGFFEAGWLAGIAAPKGTALRQSAFASGFDAGRARAEAEVQQLRSAVGEIWSILVNQPCRAGTMAWDVADDALDEATKQKLIAEMMDGD